MNTQQRIAWLIGNAIAYPIYFACRLCPPLERKVRTWLD